MNLRKWLGFLQEIGTIMYVGGILSHIVIGIIFQKSNVDTIYNVYTYKEQSAYILILPGLGLKLVTDVLLFLSFKVKPNWLKLKFIAIAFLAVNAFVFLVPMMPELVALAKNSIPSGEISEEFVEMEHREQFIGQLNIVPLLAELWLNSFKPKIGKERKPKVF